MSPGSGSSNTRGSVYCSSVGENIELYSTREPECSSCIQRPTPEDNNAKISHLLSPMSGSDLEDEAIPYKALFLKAISSARSHAQGVGRKSLISSIHPPNTFWSSTEKDLFFHGLTRYSRLRPDLIASHIGNGKTAVDVAAYLAALEAGSKSPEADNRKPPAPAARCVSSKWIEYEEKQAELLARNEMEWEKSQLVTGREGILKDARTKLRKKREKGFVRDLESKAQEQERRAEWMVHAQEYERIWDQEDVMDSLGYYELFFLDSLIRINDEKTSTLVAAARDATVEPRSSDDFLPANSPTPAETEPVSPQELESPADMSILTAVERRRLQKRLHMRKKRAEARGTTPNEDRARLRPGRKTTRPQPLDSMIKGVDSSLTRGLSSPVQASPGDDEEQQPEEENDVLIPKTEEDDDSDQDGNEGVRFKKRGLTVAQQVHVRFNELGINLGTLEDRGIDIFNLAKFWSLWDIFSDTQYDSQSVEAISSHTLQLLRACLDDFLNTLIHHTIVLAEEEKAMKEHSKVWRGQLNDIKPYHVTDALHLMGMSQHQSKNPSLARRQAQMQGEHPVARQLQPPPFPPPSSAPPQHNEVFTPLVYHPSLLVEPDLIDIQDVLLASEDESLADAKAKAEAMAELAREVAQEDMDERWDRRHEEHLWRLMGEGGEEGEDRKLDPEMADDEESMEESTTDEEEDDETMAGDSEEDMGRNEEEVRWGLLQGPSRGFNSLRTVAAGGNVKSQPFILDSDDDEKNAMSEDD